MVNMVNIADYMNNYCAPENKRKVFYLLDKTLKQKHDSGVFMSSYNINSIMISTTDPSVIEIKNCITFDTELREERRKLDILYLSLIAFNSYLPSIEVTNNLLNYDVIKYNFDDFTYIFNNQDVDYYKDLFVNGNMTYYSDYINDLNKKVNGGKSSAIVMSYSTPEGRAMSEKDAGFANTVLLTVNLLVVLLVGILLFVYMFK